MSELEARRTSRNGFFGIKIHGRHLEELSKKVSMVEINSLLHSFDKFIFVTRSDKISQAISYFAAKTTGVFHFDQEHWLQEFSIPDPVFRAEEIVALLSDILKQEKIWEDVLKRSGKPVYSVNYVDLIADYKSISKKIFEFLEIDISVIPPIPTSPMKKRSTAEFKNLLLEKIGLNPFDAL
jgi:hypothetical protein